MVRFREWERNGSRPPPTIIGYTVESLVPVNKFPYGVESGNWLDQQSWMKTRWQNYFCGKCTSHRSMWNCKQVDSDPRKPKKEAGSLSVEDNPGKWLNVDGKNQDLGRKVKGEKEPEAREPGQHGGFGHLSQPSVCTDWLHIKGQGQARQAEESKNNKQTNQPAFTRGWPREFLIN